MLSGSFKHPTRIALVDCNNFYCSCERVFQPKWQNRPVAVLSNNDGCIVARSNEVKELGIPMGVPLFQVKDKLKRAGVVIVSSNYALYGDMSGRVMNVLSQFTPEIEVYSIDEAFLDLSGFKAEVLDEYARGIVCQVKQWTGIPVGIGIGPTKVLAKLANRIAKKWKIPGGVFDIGGAGNLNDILEKIEVGDIWGIGRRLSVRLNEMNIFNARQLRDLDPGIARREFSVVMQRLVMELRGTPCMEFEDIKPKKEIMASRSFGRRVTRREELEEAVASYVSRAGEKLRNQGSVAGAVRVMAMTDLHKKNKPRCSLSCTVSLSVPTADTGKLITAAVAGLKKIYRPGYEYAKAGILLMDISPEANLQPGLFDHGDSERSKILMETIDGLNGRFGRGTIRFGQEGFKKNWRMRRNNMTAGYTTNWDELPKVS